MLLIVYLSLIITVIICLCRFISNALKVLGVCVESDGLPALNSILIVFMDMFANMVGAVYVCLCCWICDYAGVYAVGGQDIPAVRGQ